MKHWLFDLGNSRLKCAVLDERGRIGEVIAFGHDESTFAAALQDALPTREVSACLASVASPARTAMVLDVLTKRFRSISIARTQAAFAEVRIAYDHPSRLGVDRFLALIAARARSRRAWLIAGVGTAVTVDLLDAQGRHQGGRIGPSPRLMREALHHAAGHLPVQGGEYHEFASDTEDALASGCDGAALGLIERSLAQAARLLGETPALLLHGGGAEALRGQLPAAAEYAPSLVLEGLAQWARAGIPRARQRSHSPQVGNTL
jgi:type III pantothenate kinase